MRTVKRQATRKRGNEELLDQGSEIRSQKRAGSAGFAGRFGGVGDGPVSWLVMRFQARILPWIAVAAALLFPACVPAQTQGGAQNDGQSGSSTPNDSATQNGSATQNSSSQSNNVQTGSDQEPTSTPYISVNPLANVRYDNRFDASLTLAYDHTKAGPNILQGANLGGLDLSGSLWLMKHWGVESSIRAYVGTSGPAVNDANSNGGPIRGPFVAQYFAVAGPEFLGPHNKHGALIAHVLAGGVYGDFERDLLSPSKICPNPAECAAFYNDQFAPAVIMGGHFDLNRSEHWVFRLTPDAVMTHYSTNYGAKISQFDINAAFSVGMEYKFTSIRR
jgi:hypothetical protein